MFDQINKTTDRGYQVVLWSTGFVVVGLSVFGYIFNKNFYEEKSSLEKRFEQLERRLLQQVSSQPKIEILRRDGSKIDDTTVDAWVFLDEKAVGGPTYKLAIPYKLRNSSVSSSGPISMKVYFDLSNDALSLEPYPDEKGYRTSTYIPSTAWSNGSSDYPGNGFSENTYTNIAIMSHVDSLPSGQFRTMVKAYYGKTETFTSSASFVVRLGDTWRRPKRQ